MGRPKYDLPSGSRFVESHTGTVAGVEGEVHVLTHLTPKGIIYEAVFACEIATQPCHIGSASWRKPTKEQIQHLLDKDFVPYIEQQKAIREGWN